MNPFIPIIIPTFQPDAHLLELVAALAEGGADAIVIVDDGSGDDFSEVINSARELAGDRGCVLTHKKNMGKGASLKTAFAYILENYPQATGVVTADSDGQHSPACVLKIARCLSANPQSFVLGVRTFDSRGIPRKSKFGNTLTIKVLRYVTGICIQDTQTGLRGIPRDFMQYLLAVRGERFEFEMQMLLESVGRCPILEVPIETIYEPKESYQTHFNPVADSIKIYRILGKKFFRFIFASMFCFAIDLTLFTLFCRFFDTRVPGYYVALSTLAARFVSASINYTINYKMVFKPDAKAGIAELRFLLTSVAQMSLSAGFTTLGVIAFHHVPETIIKAIVDMVLFFVNYKVQQKFVFRTTPPKIQK